MQRQLRIRSLYRQCRLLDGDARIKASFLNEVTAHELRIRTNRHVLVMADSCNFVKNG